MASQISLAIRRADAIERIKAALGKLQTLVALGEPAELDPQHKDPEIRQTMLVENFATVLETVLESVTIDKVRQGDYEAQIAELAANIAVMEAAMAGEQGLPVDPEDPQVIAKLAATKEQATKKAK